jgi:hypothetical protein
LIIIDGHEESSMRTSPLIKSETMFRTVLCAVCLLAGACQTTLSQGSHKSELKSAGTATRYSVYGTIIPIVAGGAMILAYQLSNEQTFCEAFGDGGSLPGIFVGSVGIVCGPGFGHAYAGRWGHLAKGSLIRTVGTGLITWGTYDIVSAYNSNIFSNWWGGDSNEEENESYEAAVICILIGGAIYLWSAVHDFMTLDEAVEQCNRKHTGITLSVTPTYFAGENALGVVVSLGF